LQKKNKRDGRRTKAKYATGQGRAHRYFS